MNNPTIFLNMDQNIYYNSPSPAFSSAISFDSTSTPKRVDESAVYFNAQGEILSSCFDDSMVMESAPSSKKTLLKRFGNWVSAKRMRKLDAASSRKVSQPRERINPETLGSKRVCGLYLEDNEDVVLTGKGEMIRMRYF